MNDQTDSADSAGDIDVIGEDVRGTADRPGRRRPLLVRAFWDHKGTVLASAVAGVALSAGYLAVAHPKYTTTARIAVLPTGLGATQPSGGAITPGLAELAATGEPALLRTQCEVLQSTPFLAAVAADPALDRFPSMQSGDRINLLRKSLSVSSGTADDVITLAVTTPDAEASNYLAKSIVGAYMAIGGQSVQASAATVLKDLLAREKPLEDGLSAAKAKKAALEAKAAAEDKAAGGAPPEPRQLDELSKAAADAHLQEVAAKLAYEDAAGQQVSGDEPPAPEDAPGRGVGASVPDDQIVVQLQKLRTQLEELRADYLPEHPVIRTLQARIDALQRQYLATQAKHWSAAHATATSLQKQLSLMGPAVQAGAHRAADAREAREDVDRLTRRLDDLEGKIRAVNLLRDAAALNVTVLDAGAVARAPSSPAREPVLGGGALAGLLVGCSLALMREKLAPKMRSVDDVRGALGEPVLGVIPSMANVVSETARGQKCYLDPGSPVAEAYRSVRTAVYFQDAGRRAKTIVVTSPHAGEGKTTLAGNLAIVMAQSGKRVILVDGDLRHSRLQVIFNVRDRVGLAGVLAADGKPWEQAVQHTAIPGLQVLPAGPAPRDPVDLLNGESLLELLDELADRYDAVVIDTPPTLSTPDARILAATCDVTVLVMRGGKTDRRFGRDALNGLRAVGAQVGGIVLNDVSGKMRGGNLTHLNAGARRRRATPSPSAVAAPRQLRVAEEEDDESPDRPAPRVA